MIKQNERVRHVLNVVENVVCWVVFLTLVILSVVAVVYNARATHTLPNTGSSLLNIWYMFSHVYLLFIFISFAYLITTFVLVKPFRALNKRLRKGSTHGSKNEK